MGELKGAKYLVIVQEGKITGAKKNPEGLWMGKMKVWKMSALRMRASGLKRSN